MNTILTIAALVVAVTALVIAQVIAAHVKAKDEIKLFESKLRAEEARKSAAIIEKEYQEIKAKLANTLSTLTEEQLATYNRTLKEMQRPVTQYAQVVQYVPVTQFYPYNYGMQAWRGW